MTDWTFMQWGMFLAIVLPVFFAIVGIEICYEKKEREIEERYFKEDE